MGQFEEAFEEENKTDESEAEIAVMCAEKKGSVGTEVTLKEIPTNRKEAGVKLLDDPEIFVLDTGATTHSTRNGVGLIELQDANGCTARMGNGAKVSTKAIGKLPFKTTDGKKAL